MMVRLQRAVLQTVLVCLAAGTPLVPAHAGIVGTESALTMSGSVTDRAATLASVDRLLMRDDVRGQLEALGVDPRAALDRAASLTDRELAQLQARLDELPAGGNVLGVLGVVLVVLLVLELLGVTNVFTGL